MVFLMGACTRENPENDPMFVKGKAALDKKELTNARNYFKECLVKYPSSWRIHSLLGQTHFESGDYIEAIYHFRQAIANNPGGEQNRKFGKWHEQTDQLLYEKLRSRYDVNEKAIRADLEQKNLALGTEVARLNRIIDEYERGGQPGPRSETPATIPVVSPTAHNRAALEERINRNRSVTDANPPVVNPPPTVTPPPVVTPTTRDVAETPPSTAPVVNPPPTTPTTPTTRTVTVTAGPGGTVDINSLPEAVRSRLVAGDKIHRVSAGETLSAIARRYYGDSSKYTLIQRANPKLKGNTIRSGMILKIPAATPQP